MPTINPIPLKAEKLGQIIRHWRQSQGYTQQKVCDFTNNGTRFLSEVERGKKTAEIGRVLNVLSVMGLDVLLVPSTTRYTKEYQALYEIMMKIQDGEDTKPLAPNCNL